MSLAAADLGHTKTTNEDQGGPQVVKALIRLKLAQATDLTRNTEGTDCLGRAKPDAS